MIKTKRLLSLLTALTITATAFASLAIPASATQTQVATYDFEGDTLEESWSENKNQYTVEVKSDSTLGSKVLNAHVDGQTGGRTGTLTFPSPVSPDGTNPVKVDFKWNATTSVGACTTDTALTDSSGRKIFTINETTSGAVTVVMPDGTSKSVGNTGWYTVSAVVDFETHRVISLSFTANGQETAAATFKDFPFADAAADNVGAFFVQGNRASKASMTSNVYLDDISAYNVTDEYFKVTMNVKNSSNAPVADADVTLDGVAYKTAADGSIVTKLAPGSYAYTVHKNGYEATRGAEDDAAGTITVEAEAVVENVTYSEQIYDPVPATVTMAGAQKVMTAPHTAASVNSSPFTITVIDQKGVALTDGTVEWTVLPADSNTQDANVSIADGVVTVAKGFTAGETHVKNFIVAAKVTKNGESKTVTAPLAISDYLFYEPGIGGSSYGSTHAAKLNTSGTDSGTDSFISTPNEQGRTDVITLPDPVVFKQGTAQLLSFKTTVQNQTAYTYERTISVAEDATHPIVSFGYINLDIGDSKTATWSTTNSTLATVWGSIPALNEWVDVSLLFKTNAQGITKIVMNVAGNTYEMTTDATKIGAITLTQKLNNVNRFALIKDIVVSEVDVTGVNIDGAKEFSTIKDTTVTQKYAIDAMVLEEDETFTWSVKDKEGNDVSDVTLTPSDDTLTADLSVEGNLSKELVIKAESSVSTPEKPKQATLDVTVAPAQVKSATINGPATLDTTSGTQKYTVSDVKDQYDADVTKYFTPSWSVTDAEGNTTDAATMAPETGVLTISNGGNIKVKATFTNDTITSDATKDVVISTYSIVTDVSPAGATTMDVPTTGIFKDGIKKYLITTADGEGNIINQETVNAADVVATSTIVKKATEAGVKITATYENGKLKSVSEPAPVAVGDVLEESTAENTKNFYWTSLEALKPVESDIEFVKTDDVATVDTTGATKVEIAPIFEGVMNKDYNIPGDTYNVTVTATNGARCDVYANDQLIINNLNQGSDNWSVGRTITDGKKYLAGDVVIDKGSVKFTYNDDRSGGTTVSALEFVKAPSIAKRAKRLYVIGDSLTAKYYGDAAEGDEPLVRTGWGDVLQNYISGAKVTNLGNSGAWAEGMLHDAFTNVAISGQEGDILVLESGYNDSSHTSMQVMKDSVKAMVKGAEKKGMKVFIVTPNASSHSVGEYIGNVKSTGSMIEAYNELKEEGSTSTLIDLARLSGDYYRSYYGDVTLTIKDTADETAVPADTDTLLKKYYNNDKDSLHSSYNAANCWAAIVANGILKDEATASIVDTEASYTFSDGKNEITVSANQIANPADTQYNITTAQGVKSITKITDVPTTKAGKGYLVKVTLTNPDDILTAATENNNAVELTASKKNKGVYYFTMPEEDVTLTVTPATYAITNSQVANVKITNAQGDEITTAAAGDVVTITPLTGVTGVTVTKTGAADAVTATKDEEKGVWTFTMPAYAVTVASTTGE